MRWRPVMATARHRASKVLEIARDRHVELCAKRNAGETEPRSAPGFAQRDPVTICVNYRVWNAPERCSR